MKKMCFALLLLLAATVSACSSKEPVYNSIYEGLHMREQNINETENSNQIPKEHPRYDEYKREREEILNKNEPEEGR